MLTEATVTLERLLCLRESDGSGHSEPYLWPALVSIDDALNVGITTPRGDLARVVVRNDMRAGEIFDIPAGVGALSRRTDSSFRAVILVVALWEMDETPTDAMTAGFRAFASTLRAEIADKLAALGSVDEDEKAQAVEEIKKRVARRVESAIKDESSWWELLTRDFDDIIGTDFKGLEDLTSPVTPVSLAFNVSKGGRLLFYRDASQSGGGDVSNPAVIGQGGWQQFQFLFGGGNGILYAVDQQGRLLRYQDSAQDGTGDVSNPAVIGQGGWLQFKFLFGGGDDIIYAVDQQGRLLFYRDASQSGGGDVSSPSVIGQGGWQQFQFLFGGGNGVIYAVDQEGRLLRYFDASQNGTGDVSNPAVIGQGGWLQFRSPFSDENGVIYAVDQEGRLLRYVDASQSGGGDVSNPMVIGQGGWQAFKFLFAGGNGIIYAAEHEADRSPNEYEIQGRLEVRAVAADPCQADVDAVQGAQGAVDGVLASIEALQDDLRDASPTEKPAINREIKRLREDELPVVAAALTEAQHALEACRA